MKNEAWLGPVRCGPRDPVRVIGAINVSPESFFRESVKTNARALAKAARAMERNRADLVDVGAMSTAPYLLTKITEQDEARRLAWAVRIVRDHCDLPVSIDTSRYGPAEAGLEAGAAVLNDVNALAADPRIAPLARKARGLILMANPGLHATGRAVPIDGVKRLLKAALARAHRARISPSKIVLDPGIGFFRKERMPWWKWDLAVLRDFGALSRLGRPLLLGVSRKSFIGHVLGGLDPSQRLPGSLAATIAGVIHGARVIRTHDVAETRQALGMLEAIRSSKL